MQIKQCGSCKKLKEQDEFYRNNTKRTGFDGFCKSCSNKAKARWRELNPRKLKESRDKWKIKNPFYKQIESWRTYGINYTPKDYRIQIIQQNQRCAICKRHKTEFKNKLAVDHDHKTGKVRGLLCINCNRGLGLFKDSPKIMEKAISYLQTAVR